MPNKFHLPLNHLVVFNKFYTCNNERQTMLANAVDEALSNLESYRGFLNDAEVNGLGLRMEIVINGFQDDSIDFFTDVNAFFLENIAKEDILFVSCDDSFNIFVKDTLSPMLCILENHINARESFGVVKTQKTIQTLYDVEMVFRYLIQARPSVIDFDRLRYVKSVGLSKIGHVPNDNNLFDFNFFLFSS